MKRTKIIWKDIPCYEGLYRISTMGQVKSLSRIVYHKRGTYFKAERILKPHEPKTGYSFVVLCKDNKKWCITIHVLMAITFLNHTPNGHVLEVDHINHNPYDNRLENLQIITARENISKDKRNKTSKYTGVYWDTQRRKWRTEITFNRVTKYLGHFINEKEASIAYQKALSEITHENTLASYADKVFEVSIKKGKSKVI